MQNFLNGSIDIEEFSDSIFALRREVGQEINDTYVKLVSESSSEKFQYFNPNLRVKGCSSLAGSLYILSDYYEDYAEYDSRNQKFSEDIKQYLLKL
jgi:hypothetical protein